MKWQLSTLALVAVVFIVSLPRIALAQEGENPPEATDFITVNEQGQLTFDINLLTPLRTVKVPPPEGFFYREIKVSFLGVDFGKVVLGAMKYNKYVTPKGQYVLVPSAYTTFVLAQSGTTPFDALPTIAIVNPLVWGPAAAGGYDETAFYMGGFGDILEDLAAQDNDALAMRALVHASFNPFDDAFNQGNPLLAGGIFVYECDPQDPACQDWLAGNIPGSEPTALPPLPPGSACAEPSIVQGDIRAVGELVDPPYPVVVGQDNAKRGADLLWRVEIPPVIYTWHETKVVGVEKVCSFVGGGSGGGCSEPVSQYDRIESAAGIGEVDISTSDWAVVETPITECEEHVEVYSEQLNWVQAFANLSQESRDWIETGDLQQRYPGAKLYQPDWEWTPPLVGEVLGDGTYVWEVTYEHIQFQDPGQYSMSVQGGTTGTPVTEARFIDLGAGEFSVWLYEATITQ